MTFTKIKKETQFSFTDDLGFKFLKCSQKKWRLRESRGEGSNEINSGRNRSASKLIRQWKVLKKFHGRKKGSGHAHTGPGLASRKGSGKSP